jgi:hypothetical protein
MPSSTIAGGVIHSAAVLSEAERHAAESVLAKLRQSGSTLGSHLSSSLASATVYSGSTLSLRPSTVGLGTSTLLSARGSDTFMGGARTAPLSAFHIGSDTVVGGSTSASRSETFASRAQHFALSSDTISVAGTTAASIQAGHPLSTTGAHTVTLADKTTIKIAGLSAHDISKLHH